MLSSQRFPLVDTVNPLVRFSSHNFSFGTFGPTRFKTCDVSGRPFGPGYSCYYLSLVVSGASAPVAAAVILIPARPHHATSMIDPAFPPSTLEAN